MSNKVIGDYTAAITIDGSTHYLLIQPGSSSTAYNRINRSVFLGVSGQPVDISTSQTLSNKIIGNTNSITVKDGSFTLQDDSDTSKQAQFQLSSITTATTRTYTLPNASGILADTSSAQTFTNKTLTSPTITGGSIDNTTITVNAITGHTTPNTGTIYGLSITSGTIGTAGYANASITPSKLATGATAANVATSETTASTSYVDLATVTDSVTVTVGANGLALLVLASELVNSGANSTRISFAASGANTIAASDLRALVNAGVNDNAFAWSYLLTGLVAGSTTFKMKYRVSGGTGTFLNRYISVVPL